MAQRIDIVCDRCRRKPKAGLKVVHVRMTEAVSGADPVNSLDKTALWCPSCRDRACRFIERSFETAVGPQE